MTIDTTLEAQHISHEVAALPDDWEALTSAAIQHLEDEEVKRWTIGEIGKRIKDNASYGDKRVRDFAHTVGLKAPTLYERIEMVEFWPIHLRNYAAAEYSGLRWSHYRVAKKLKLLDKAHAMLIHKMEQNLTTVQMEAQVRLLMDDPKPVLVKQFECAFTVVPDAPGEIMGAPDGWGCVMVLLPVEHVAQMHTMGGGVVRVYEVVAA